MNKGLITFGELCKELRRLEETRGMTERELEAMRGREERIEQFQRYYSPTLRLHGPEALGSLTS